MKKHFAALGIALVSMGTLLSLFLQVGSSTPNQVLATAPDEPPVVTAVQPDTAPNDLDTPVVITGTGFAAVLSGTQVITPPLAFLGDTALEDVVWVSTTTLSATVPWGLNPGVYTLTVTNPNGGSGSLLDAFTVTQAIGVWTTNGPYGGRIAQLIVNPYTPTIVYAIADGVGMFASYDRAQHWEPISDASVYEGYIAMDAGNPNELFIAGGGYMYRTQDGGNTWTELIGRESPLHHCYVHRLVPHPSSSGIIYDAVSMCPGFTLPTDLSGVYRSEDHGETWITLTVGLTDTRVTALAIQSQDPQRILAGTENGNLFFTTDGGEHWNHVATISDDIRRIHFNPYESQEAWVVPALPYQPPSTPRLYRSTNLTDWIPIVVESDLSPNGGIWSLAFEPDTIWAAGDQGYVSVDGGDSWTKVMGPELQACVRWFALDPSNPSLVYASDCEQGILKSGDRGATWERTNEGLAAVATRDVAVTPGEPDSVYANIYEYGLLKSENGGRAWQSLGIRKWGPPKGKDVAVDPFVPTRVYYTGECSGNGPCIWISQNAGYSMTEVTIPPPPAYTGWFGNLLSIAPHPLVSGTLFAGAGFYQERADYDTGTEPSGIYVSDDHGETWQFLGPTPAISEVIGIAFDALDPDLIYAATRGSGLWKSTDHGATWTTTPLPGSPFIVTVATHPSQPNTVYVINSAAGGDLATGLFVSQDAGETWQLNDQEGIGAQLLFAPTQPPILYSPCAFEERLCRSTDGGDTWQEVAGIVRPQVLAAGTDGERFVIYVGTPGGLVSPIASATRLSEGQILRESIPGRGSLMGAGIYRLTLLPPKWVYLPLVQKIHTP